MLHLLLVIVELSSIVTSSYIPDALRQSDLLSTLLATMELEKVNLGYSLKNIPIPSNQEYLLEFINSSETLVTTFRWDAFFFLNPDKKPTPKETYNFKSTRTAPKVKELCPFENRMLELCRDIQFDNSYNNSLQQKLKEDRTMIENSNKIFISADKTTNFFKTSVECYEEIMTRNITKCYKKSDPNRIKNVTKEQKEIVHQLDIDNRVFKTSQRESYVTLKDHKQGYENSPTFRLINPTKPEIGRVSKQILQKFVKELRIKTCYNQWEDSSSAIKWFNSVKNEPNSRFIQFDIKDFYPSITEELLTAALDWAQNFVIITEEDRNIIIQCKKTFLYHNSEPWDKKVNPDCDVTMGSYDGAETCDMVGLFLLSKIQHLGINVGLYRDDGLAVSTKTKKQNDNIKKQITRIFKEHDLTLLFDVMNGKSVNFLDINFNLETKLYKPYMKPNDMPLYVHCKSNHPKNVKENIPLSVQKRLSKISSNGDIFDQACPTYQKALDDAGYEHPLKFNPTDNIARKNRSRRKKFFNPPFSLNVKTNVGAKFLRIIDECFPKSHILNKIFNRNTVKLSYKCMPNMQTVIARHNAKLLKSNPGNTNPPPCNHRQGNVCPLDGKCKTPNIVYKATVKSGDSVETYTGLTEPPFQKRFQNHKSDFQYQKNRNNTALASHIWALKDQNQDFSVNFQILKKARAFNPVNRKCMLCLTEKYSILFNPTGASLNKRSEFFNSCRHKTNKLLSLQKA